MVWSILGKTLTITWFVTVMMVLIGVLAGILTDVFSNSDLPDRGCADMVVHDSAPSCRCFDPATILLELRQPSAARGTLVVGTLLFVLAVLSGAVGPAEWNWIRVTFLGVGLFSLFVVATVPEHFIAEHLWRHILVRHAPRIFLWTCASMTLIAVLDASVNAEAFLRHNPWLTLVGAAGLGLVPESGPHLLVVMLYAAGNVPVSALLASSIVQDGHGMLPLLASSWRTSSR